MKYFLLKINTFINSFSIVESGKTLSFELLSALDSATLSSINVDDMIIGCITTDCTARMVFKVKEIKSGSRIMMVKELDISNGGTIDKKLAEQLEQKDLIEIDETNYNSIYSTMIKDIIGTQQSNDMFVIQEPINDSYSVEELGNILLQMYNDPAAASKTAAIHVFGIKYGRIIRDYNYSSADIISSAGISENYQVELGKGLRIFDSLKNNEFGIKFYENENVNTASKPKKCIEIKRNARTIKIHPLNQIIYGAPGTGKTYSTAEYALAIIENRPIDRKNKNESERKAVMDSYKNYINKGQIVFTTFHQSYGYEEFIQGLRPDTKSERMTFKTVDGTFKKIADTALNDSQNNYVIIIDEINRANISKVFGELITLIEEDKRWGEINETCATLQSGDIFAVPNNLYIVGTMNSADKSISLIDAALRRRFEFVEQKPQPELVSDTQLKKVLNSLNNSLVDDLESADLLIGHSYFMNKTAADLVEILNNSIIPLLYEYFYDNKNKVASVLSKAIEGTGISLIDDKMGRLSVKRDNT